ncbi:MAG: M16 family metallopeptidase [Nitrospinaceae bacterium]
MNLTEPDLKNYTDVLPNGLTVVTIEMPHIHTMEIAMFVRAGLRFENEKNNGISHFLEHMMFRGNKQFPDSILLNREFEAIGRELRASTLSEYTYYGFTPHISQVEKAVELFAAFFTDPTFPQIDLEREIILEEYLEELNENGENVDIDNQACQLIYPGTPLALPTVGNEKTIKSITEGLLRDYFKTYYIPANMVLVGAGPIRHDNFSSLVKKYFSVLPNGASPVSKQYFQCSMKEDQKDTQVLFQYDSDSQVQLQICFRSISYNHPDYYVLCLINRIFDDGYTSRLQRALREDRGLVYSVECRVTSLSDTGTVDFDVTVRPEKICEVIKILFQEIRTFLETGPAREELDHVKRRYYFDLDFDRDDPCKQIVRYGFSRLYSREISADEEWARVEKITVEDVLNVARKIFVAEKLNVILVGPYTPQIKEELEKIAKSF